MRVRCDHGYFRFEEFEPGDISRFMSLFGLELSSNGDHYTFDDLLEAPEYSLAGGTYLGAPTTETFEGKPWEVMRANGLIYDFTTRFVVPLELITNIAKIKQAGNYFLADGMIIPGSITDDGSRVTDYSAHFNFDGTGFRYSEIHYE